MAIQLNTASYPDNEIKEPPSKPVSQYRKFTPACNRATLATTLDPYTKQEIGEIPDAFIVNQLCEDPSRLYDNLDKLLLIIDIDPALLDLRLCRCGRMSSLFRSCIENSVIDCLLSQYDPDSSIAIMSVGAGGCYQELVYLARLAKAGFHNFRLILIEPKPIPLKSLTAVCRRYLPQCEIALVHYPTVFSCQSQGLKPSLLLLLDLLDRGCEVNGKKLPDYSFEILHKNHVLQKNTVIAWNILKDNPEEEGSLLSIGYCGIYSETDETLATLGQKRVVGTHHAIGNSERSPFKRDFSVINKSGN